MEVAIALFLCLLIFLAGIKMSLKILEFLWDNAIVILLILITLYFVGYS